MDFFFIVHIQNYVITTDCKGHAEKEIDGIFSFSLCMGRDTRKG